MLSTPPLKRAQMKYQPKNLQLSLPLEGPYAEGQAGFAPSAEF